MDEQKNYDPNARRTRAEASGSAKEDRIAGGFEQAKGRVKESAGALSGNERLKAEGESEQLGGKVRSKKGQWKDRLKGWIDRL